MIDPVSDPRYNVREVCKEMILLERHLALPNQFCQDCIRKHFLTVEALLEEAMTLGADPVLYKVLTETHKGWRVLQRQWLGHQIANPDLAQKIRRVRKALTPGCFSLMATRVAARSLMANFNMNDLGEFLFTKDDAGPTREIPPEDLAKRYFERQVGHVSEQRLLKEVMRDAKVLQVSHFYLYVHPHKAWFLYTGLDEDKAVRLGKRAIKGLIGRRNLHYTVPGLHEVPLWVGTSDGKAVLVKP